jgi:hypothetical protein
VTFLDQARHDPPPDDARGAGDEDAHGDLVSWLPELA